MILTKENILREIPDKDSLLLADALLFAVYGWNPEKVKRMSLGSVSRWVIYAKKRMTWGDAFKMRQMLLPRKKVSLWDKIFKTKP